MLAAQNAPSWVKLLHWMSGDTDRTTVPVMPMGLHMQMSEQTQPKPGDAARAQAIVQAAVEVLKRYPTRQAAERAGYKPFHELNQIGEEIHFTSIGHAYSEGKHVDYAHPGSLLFKRTNSGLLPVGVMYTAANTANDAELNRRAPLSFARWHRHVHFCFGSDNLSRTDSKAAPRFGYDGSLHTESDCKSAGGYWISVAFGWMTHVYPNERDAAQIWGGESMTMSPESR